MSDTITCRSCAAMCARDEGGRPGFCRTCSPTGVTNMTETIGRGGDLIALRHVKDGKETFNVCRVQPLDRNRPLAVIAHAPDAVTALARVGAA